MAGGLVRIPPDLTLQDAVDRYFMRYDHSAFPVDEYGRTISLLTLRKVRRVPSDQWPVSRVRDHMVPLGDQVVVPPDAPMDQVMAKLEDGEAGRVLAAAPRQARPGKRQPPRSPSARPVRYAPNGWPYRCGTGISAIAAPGAAWSPPTPPPSPPANRPLHPPPRHHA